MDKKMLTKVAVAGVACMAICGAAFAGPHGGFGGHHRGGPGPGFHHGGPRPGPHFGPGPAFHHHHHYSGWGRGGRYFWPGFVGGVVGGAIYNAVAAPSTVVVSTPTVVTTPSVVTTPVVATPVSTVQSVWVEGRYVDQVQANGVVVRVWQPGHYEQRTVFVQ